jgi:hypothetical protein
VGAHGDIQIGRGRVVAPRATQIHSIRTDT